MTIAHQLAISFLVFVLFMAFMHIHDLRKDLRRVLTLSRKLDADLRESATYLSECALPGSYDPWAEAIRLDPFKTWKPAPLTFPDHPRVPKQDRTFRLAPRQSGKTLQGRLEAQERMDEIYGSEGFEGYRTKVSPPGGRSNLSGPPGVEGPKYEKIGGYCPDCYYHPCICNSY